MRDADGLPGCSAEQLHSARPVGLIMVQERHYLRLTLFQLLEVADDPIACFVVVVSSCAGGPGQRPQRAAPFLGEFACQL